MSTTTNYGFSKPAGSDSPNGPVQIGALADEVDAELAGGIGFRSRGKSKVTASQTTSSGTFTLLGTPDRVSGLEIEEDGLICARFSASLVIPSGCSMEVHIYANQPSPDTLIQASHIFGEADHGKYLYTTPSGLSVSASQHLDALGSSGPAPIGMLTGAASSDDDCTVAVEVRRIAGASPVGLSSRLLHAYTQNFG